MAERQKKGVFVVVVVSLVRRQSSKKPNSEANEKKKGFLWVYFLCVFYKKYIHLILWIFAK